jgi:hypothetical protein
VEKVCFSSTSGHDDKDKGGRQPIATKNSGVVDTVSGSGRSGEGGDQARSEWRQGTRARVGNERLTIFHTGLRPLWAVAR